MASKRKDTKGRVLNTGESQRKDGTYMYRYTDRFGKRQCVYAATLKELRQKEREITVRSELGVQMTPTNATLKSLLKKQAVLIRSRRTTTQKQYEVQKQLLCKYEIAVMPVHRITATYAKSWLIGMAEEGYAGDTIRNVARLAKSTCQRAIADGDIYTNPFEFKLDFLPTSNHRHALNKQEQESFLEFLSSKKRYAIYYDHVVALLETGLRIGEFVGLTENAIDLDNRLIYVMRQVQGGQKSELQVMPPKSRAGVRTIPMSDKAYIAFTNIMTHYKTNGVVIDPVDGIGDFVVRGKNGTYIPPRSYPHYYKVLCDAYNKHHDQQIHVTPHVLRHSFCTNLAHEGVSWPSIQYLMGHASMDTTIKVYTHNDKNTAIDEFRRHLNRQNSDNSTC